MSGRRRQSPATRFMRLGGEDRRLLAEVAFLLPFARLAVAFLPFRWIVGFLERPMWTGSPGAEVDIARLRWAIRVVARRAPFRAMCFEQALVAYAMLRRRGVRSTLYYGVARDAAGGLIAHVWVRTTMQDVIGLEGSERFSVVAQFPRPVPSTDGAPG